LSQGRPAANPVVENHDEGLAAYLGITLASRCCGMRDQGNAAEARRAAETGRPPLPRPAPPQDRDNEKVLGGSATTPLIEALSEHLFGNRNCCGLREHASAAEATAAGELGRPPRRQPPEHASRNAQEPIDHLLDEGGTPHTSSRAPYATLHTGGVSTAGPWPRNPPFPRPAVAPSEASTSSLGFGRESSEQEKQPERVDDDILAEYYRMRGIQPSSGSGSTTGGNGRRGGGSSDRMLAQDKQFAVTPLVAHEEPLKVLSAQEFRPPDSDHEREPTLDRAQRPSPLSSSRYETAERIETQQAALALEATRHPCAARENVGKIAPLREQVPSRGAAQEETRQPEASAPRQKQKWIWPAWALDSTNPCIEVFVEDEDHPDGGAWVDAVPQSRVVDVNGADTFLHAQYTWDGELYDQEFEPQHVRQRGAQKTALDVFLATTWR